MDFFSVSNLTAGYGKKPIVENLSFSIDSGCMLGILGANGSGKTTLLKALCGILPHTGSCVLDGTVLEKLSPGSWPSAAATSPKEAASPSTFPLWMWFSWALTPNWACWSAPPPP